MSSPFLKNAMVPRNGLLMFFSTSRLVSNFVSKKSYYYCCTNNKGFSVKSLKNVQPTNKATTQFQLPSIIISKRTLFIEVQETPNPNSVKFHPQRIILPEGVQPRDFPNTKSTVDCNLASQLHHVNGVQGVYIGTDFITISKSEDISWSEINSEIKSILMEYLSVNQFVHMSTPIVGDKSSSQPLSSSSSSKRINDDEDDEVVELIKELIETKIRPTVQEDGGDIVYVGFEEGIVKVKLQGSCTTCPSSQVTLKRGVQNMLQFYVPEVMGVIQVEDEKDELSNKEFGKFEATTQDKNET